MADGNGSAKANQLALIRRAAQLSPEAWTDERLNAIVSMFAGNAKTSGQAAVFLAVADKYDLAPEMGEIWLGQIRGKPHVLVGRDAYIKVAQRDPGYAGFQADIVREGDDYEVERKGADVTIHHRKAGFGGRGKILGAYALVPHKDRAPVYIEKHIEELEHLLDKDVWRDNTAEMVLTRALTFALKLQFNITGVYSPADEVTSEDLDDIASRKVAGESAQQMDQLKERMQRVRVWVEEEKEEGVVPDVEIVVEDEDEAEAGSGVGSVAPEPEARREAVPGVPPPAEATPEDQSEFQRGRGAYFAKAGEVFADDDERKAWQSEYMENASAAHWSTDDYRKAAAMLEDGLGIGGETPMDETGQESMPV